MQAQRSSYTSNVENGDRSSHSSKVRTSRFVKGTALPKPPNTDGVGLRAMLMHPISLLMVCFPFGVFSALSDWGATATFWLNFLALIPMAKILGDATEELAAGLKNDMLAGLLNATFGNAVEMVMMVQTLRQGQSKMSVVKAMMLGSVLSNLLLVLGMSFFCGGLLQQTKRKRSGSIMEPNGAMPINSFGQPMHNNRGSVQIRRLSVQADMQLTPRLQNRSSVMPDKALAVADNSLPKDKDIDDLKEQTYEFAGEVVQTFSVMSALVNTSMLLLSCLSFSLVTVFTSSTQGDRDTDEWSEVLVPVSRSCSIIIMMAYVAYIFFQLVTHREAMAMEEGDGGEFEEEEPSLSIGTAILVMLCTTILVAFSSEYLVDSLDGVVMKSDISLHFISIILLPIVGNACEHASAIRFAIMDKPGLSIGIAIGSSTQISLFVVPCAVLIGWILGLPMDLDFGNLNTTVMSISVIVVLSVVVDGKANWLQGYLLMSGYLIIAVLYWHLPNSADKEVEL